MSTTLLNAEILLSKELGDYWSGTTTSAGNTAGTTLIDTALCEKEDDWITDTTYDMLPTGTYEERKVKNLVNENGEIGLVRAHGAQIATSTAYRLHRLFSASDKKIALIYAAKKGFSDIHKSIRDESHVSGNWLKDGSFEIWISTSALTYWTTTTVTITKTTSSPYYKHGTTSCKLSGSAGSIKQSVSNWDDLKHLAGKSVTFSVQGHSDAASNLRIGIYDGTTYTYSDYHAGNTAWTEDNDPLEVTATIKDNPTVIEFIIYQDVANKNSYVDDARVIGADGNRIYIGDLGLAQNQPHQILIEPSDYSQAEPWILLRGITYDYANGYMYLPLSVSVDYRLRILGTGYLDFLVSGVSSTDWTATIDIDSPQTEILVAEAAIYLCNQMIVPNETPATTTRWQSALAYWHLQLLERRRQYGMIPPSVTIHYGVD